eukprot:CAMPEP_0170921122 /NCGR_PEP_ID=MMETSP0735-20130129/9643_1 /TAXON_ID=186038 /ORGANISM="Fragilariopsis kerguelensis, Strain L26-C5" /LENGTH=41 /DNA_ID= /DNA_START= /DNA_END= /DNA_ORIENTATION=
MSSPKAIGLRSLLGAPGGAAGSIFIPGLVNLSMFKATSVSK